MVFWSCGIDKPCFWHMVLNKTFLQIKDLHGKVEVNLREEEYCSMFFQMYVC